VDAQFDRLNIDKSDRRLGSFGIRGSGADKSGPMQEIEIYANEKDLCVNMNV